MKNFRQTFGLLAMGLFGGYSLPSFRGRGSVIAPYSNDYSTPSVRKYSPDERRARKRANRRERRRRINKRGWA